MSLILSVSRLSAVSSRDFFRNSPLWISLGWVLGRQHCCVWSCMTVTQQGCSCIEFHSFNKRWHGASSCTVFVTSAARRNTGKVPGQNDMSAVSSPSPCLPITVFRSGIDGTSGLSAVILRGQGAVHREEHFTHCHVNKCGVTACYWSLAGCESSYEPSSRWPSRSHNTTTQGKLLDSQNVWVASLVKCQINIFMDVCCLVSLPSHRTQ